MNKIKNRKNVLSKWIKNQKTKPLKIAWSKTQSQYKDFPWQSCGHFSENSV